MARTEQEINELTNELIKRIDKELRDKTFDWSIEVYNEIKRNFITEDIFEPLTEEDFDEYDSDEERREAIIDNFEAAASDLADELQDQQRFIHETADASRVTFITSEAHEFYDENMEECDEVAKIYDLNPTNEDDLLSVNYHVQRSRIEDDAEELAEFFESIEGSDYL